MGILTILGDVVKGIAVVVAAFAMICGVYYIGFTLTGQSNRVVLHEYAEPRKARVASGIVLGVIVLGVVLWALTGVPFIHSGAALR